MTAQDIISLRLSNQQLFTHHFTKPSDVVSWFGAIQAQDYLGALWAVGQRLDSATEQTVEQAISDGEIVRIHVMRPTWHYVSRDFIRPLLTMTAPRVHKISAYYYKQVGLTHEIFAKAHKLLATALTGNKQLTRSEIVKLFNVHGIETKGPLRLGYILFNAELHQIICSGGRRGKQITYALFDERIPQRKMFNHDETLEQLTKTYFLSHGPATVHDFSWWSGLTVAESKRGIEMIEKELISKEVNGTNYYFSKKLFDVTIPSPHVSLQPAFDEYTISYKDRSLAFTDSYANQNLGYGIFLVINGHVEGTWKRTISKKNVEVSMELFRKLTSKEKDAVEKEIQRYGTFLGLPAVMK